METTGEPSVFLSYARKDAGLADALEAGLRDRGLAVWRDIAGIGAGHRFRDEIGNAIRSSAAVVCALSPRSARSDEVLTELEFAREERIPILPAYVEPLREPMPTQLRMLLAGLHHVELYKDFDNGVASLAEAVAGHSARRRSEVEVPTFSELMAMGADRVADLAAGYEKELSGGRVDTRRLIVVGQCYLYLGRHSEARDRLRRAVREDPTSATALYSLALAVVGGRRPRALTMRDAEGIARLLDRAASQDPASAHYDHLAAVVKVDYYEGNGLLVPPPSVDELTARAATKTLDASEVERILHTVEVAGEVKARVFGR